ncbi:hypothetical protein SAMN05192546_11166 [Tindallia californiensis]|uniref:Uncharacterized protein n=1 Tax=Tindallia californiensis TaxID=159292 RepID=A0A1H3R0B9_9FIRM|nr:hypothetical protein SAMN05192546_11166 [Tindallia californiensis]
MIDAPRVKKIDFPAKPGDRMGDNSKQIFFEKSGEGRV